MNFPGDDGVLPDISILKMGGWMSQMPEFKVNCYLPNGFIKPTIPSFPILHSEASLY